MKKIKKKAEPKPKDICSKCGVSYEDILGIGSCGKCFYNDAKKVKDENLPTG